MTVATWAQPDYTTDTPTEYKTNIDAATSVLHGIGGQFAPHEASTPNMTIVVDAGIIQASSTGWTEKAQQTSGTITAPSVNPRYDIAVINYSTGTLAIRTGSEAASPSDPALTAGDIPIARIQLQTSTTAITNSIIDDLRTFSHASLFGGQPASNYARTDVAETFGNQVTLNDDLPLYIGTSNGGVRLRQSTTFNNFSITPKAAGSYDTTKEIWFDADLGYWNIEGSPRADGGVIWHTGNDADLIKSNDGPQSLNNDLTIASTGFQISPATANNGRIELGYIGGSATNSYIDFHTGATAVDYDSRIIASGGTGTSGQGALNIIASSATINSNTVWHAGNFPAPTIKVKTTSETVNNSITLQDDDHLAGFTLDSNSWYEFEAVLFVASFSSAGFKHAFSFSNTPQEIGYTYEREHDDVGSYYSTFLTSEAGASSNISSGTTVSLRGVFQTNATTGGTLTLQWAQGTATVADTILYATSFMKINKFTPA